MPNFVAAAVACVVVFFALAIILLAWAGRIGKPGLDRARAIPKGYHRTRSRDEVMAELRQGCVALDRAEAEAKSAAVRFARLTADLKEARANLTAVVEGGGHA